MTATRHDTDPDPDSGISPEMTVNEVIQRVPEALAVFSEFGIDACCGGSLPLAEVAERHRIEYAAIVRAVTAASRDG